MSVDSNDSVHGLGQNQASDPAKSGDGLAGDGDAGQTRHELLVIETGGRLLAVFTEDVNGIVAGKIPAALPRAPASVLGVIAFRGRMLTVIDPLPLLGQLSQTSAHPIAVALSGDEQLALAADSSRGAIEVFAADIQLSEKGSKPEIIYGALLRGGEQISILNVARLFGATVPQHERRRRRF
ncbi:MAG: chemotaxis protein CheW [Pyrinomonadaceae bacterium]